MLSNFVDDLDGLCGTRMEAFTVQGISNMTYALGLLGAMATPRI
jgi:hypothetical protein